MDELTMELFQMLVPAGPEQDWHELAYPWLTALLRLSWLSGTERKNAGVLLDFLEGLPDSGDFASLFRAARAKLAFEAPKTWDMEFPENYRASVDGEELDADGLRRRGVEYVDFNLSKPIRGSLEYSVKRRLHAGGTVELLPDYQVFTAPAWGERHLFHVYGEKAVSGQS